MRYPVQGNTRTHVVQSVLPDQRRPTGHDRVEEHHVVTSQGNIRGFKFSSEHILLQFVIFIFPPYVCTHAVRLQAVFDDTHICTYTLKLVH